MLRAAPGVPGRPRRIKRAAQPKQSLEEFWPKGYSIERRNEEP